EECLWLQAWMRGDGALFRAGGGGFDNVTKWALRRNSSETTSSPFAQVVLDTAVQGLAEDQPRFPHRPGHDAYFGKLKVRVLGTITAPHRHHESGDFTAPFKPGTRQGIGYYV